MRKAILALFFAGRCMMTMAAPVSEATTISLLTGSPGAELYSTFGHSAIRVKDPMQNMDVVYNYGTFNFNTPNFYLKFVRGKLEYMLSRNSFDQFIPSYAYENRSIVEQQLNLNLAQKRKLVMMLEENYKTENRYYKYDFFFDNCATRIRDLMITALGDDFTYIYPDHWVSSKLTFRNLIDLYLSYHHWSDFGIDIALGLPTDAHASPADYMFLPDYLAEGFENATIMQDGASVPFVMHTATILKRVEVVPEVYLITPTRLMWGIFCLSLILSFKDYKLRLSGTWFDKMYFSIIGLIGWIVFLLWFFTDHIATKDNLNVLWAVPVHFPIVLFWKKLSGAFKRVYSWIFGVVDLLILILWAIFPQSYHTAFIPLILIILMRFALILKAEGYELKASKFVN